MKFLVAPLAIALVAALLASCAKPGSDEQQVRELIAQVEEAAEARDASDVLEHVDATYSDDNGFDKSRLQSFLRGYFLANPKVEVLIDIESLELPVPGLAQVRLDVTVVPAGDRATLDVELRRHDGDWRVVRAGRPRDGR